jgi:hypothetical protein
MSKLQAPARDSVQDKQVYKLQEHRLKFCCSRQEMYKPLQEIVQGGLESGQVFFVVVEVWGHA